MSKARSPSKIALHRKRIRGWAGRPTNHIGKEPYYKTLGTQTTLIREIRVYHGDKRIWKFVFEWQSGQAQSAGSTSWATGNPRWEGFRLLDNEVITFMHVETFPQGNERSSVIGLQFQTNKGRWSPYFGRNFDQNLPQGLGRDFYSDHFITAGTVLPQGASLEDSSRRVLSYINSFALYMCGTNIGMQAIQVGMPPQENSPFTVRKLLTRLLFMQPLWNSHKTIETRKIVDMKTQTLAGQSDIGYDDYFTDADMNVLTPERLERAILQRIQLWKKSNHICAMQISVLSFLFLSFSFPRTQSSFLTWSDGVESITGDLRGSTAGAERTHTFTFEQNESVVGIEFWHSTKRVSGNLGGIYSMQFIYNIYTPKGMSSETFLGRT
ncbi:hypothetical protein BDW02DRAFT_650272 [Decorospora gaudefroyi]|uniref:Jacalin-type lectin domain-containing protein n=1 Tax=Decorospora gaudefroyi TaxID=184978 RepID=A0A6A5K298_9PLEO|nr:hypothetical protein BDW02DRAFT_650272 [Decorospora gaudefroyi]